MPPKISFIVAVVKILRRTPMVIVAPTVIQILIIVLLTWNSQRMMRLGSNDMAIVARREISHVKDLTAFESS